MSDQPTIARTAGSVANTATQPRTPGIPQLVVLLAASCLPTLIIGITAPFDGILADKIDRKRCLSP